MHIAQAPFDYMQKRDFSIRHNRKSPGSYSGFRILEKIYMRKKERIRKEASTWLIDKEVDEMSDELNLRRNKGAYVAKRFCVQMDEFIWHPMIKISSSIYRPKFMNVGVPVEEVCIRINILGKIVEMSMSCETTASDILHVVWRDFGIIKGFDEDSLVLSFITSEGTKKLAMEDRPLLEILQWKLRNSMLSVANHKLVPKNSLFKACGFEMRVRAQNKDTSEEERDYLVYQDTSEKIVYDNSLLPAKQKEESSKSIISQYNFVIGSVQDIIIFSITITALLVSRSNSFLYKIETIKSKAEWIVNVLGVSVMVYLVLPQIIELFLQKEHTARPHTGPSVLSEIAVEPTKEKEAERHKTIVLNLSRMGLIEIPDMVYNIANIAHLDISHNIITVLPERLNRIGLKSINASNNRIARICSSIKIPLLNLAENHISEFESEYVYKELNLLDNPLQKFKAHAEKLFIRSVFSARRIYGSLMLLKKVHILDVEMKKFVGRFPCLVDLQLVNNSLEEISVFAPKLKTLLCAHNFLLQFPYIEQTRDGRECNALRSISLPYNALNLIPSSVWTLPIKYLNVSHNQIVRIDPSARQVTLRHLNISGNQIKEIDNISRLAGLMCFISSFNMLESVSGLEALPELKLIDLSYNMLRGLPKLPAKRETESLAFYAMGNVYMPYAKSKIKRLASGGVNVFLGECEDNLAKVPKLVGGHSRCIECGAYVPKEQITKEEEKKKMHIVKRAQCLIREVMTQPCDINENNRPVNVQIFAYFSSKDKKIKTVIDKALNKIANHIQTETIKSLRTYFESHRQNLHRICTEVKYGVFPKKIDVLCFVILVEKYVCIIGDNEIDLILFRDERGAYLCNTSYLSTVGFTRRKTDECIMAIPRAVLKEISVTDLIIAYKRIRSITEVQRFLFSHELRDFSIFVVPLIPRADHSVRKEKDTPGLKILEKLSAYNITSQFVRVPIVIFTDIVNSTKLWSNDSIKMMQMVKIHNTTVRTLMRKLGGYEVKTEGDSFMMVFYDVQCAIEFGAEIHRDLLKKNWPEIGIENNPLIYSNNKPLYRGLQIRVGISKGACVVENDPITKRLDFYGKSVIEAARLCSLASAGETLITHTMYNRIKDIKNRRYIIIPRGRVVLSGLEADIHHIYEVLHTMLIKRLLLKSPHVIRKCGWILA